MTFEEFLAKATAVHGDAYQYTPIAGNIKYDTKVDIICPTHGQYTQSVRTHIVGKSGCKKCSEVKRLDTIQRRYGVSNPMQNPDVRRKAQTTLLERTGSSNPMHIAASKSKQQQSVRKKYGCDFPMQSAEVRSRRESNNLDKHGVAHTAQLPTVVAKKEKTWKEKYSTDHPWKNNEVRQAIYSTMVERYGGHCTFSSPVLVSKINQDMMKVHGVRHRSHIGKQQAIQSLLDYDFMYDHHVTQQLPLSSIASILDIDGTTVGRYLHLHGISTQRFYVSQGEIEVRDMVSSFCFGVISNDRTIIAPKELDIVISSHQLAIEYCGLFWHGEYRCNAQYHHTKWKQCYAKGIQLLTVFEDEWKYKSPLIERKIRALTNNSIEQKRNARQCVIDANVSMQERDKFLELNHLQGQCKGSVSIGLRYNGELVSLAVFQQSKPTRWLLSRYATSCRVRGGLSRIMAHFFNTHEWSEIVSFADLRWSNGAMYERTGWKQVGIIDPDYYWTDGHARWHKFNYRHSRLKSKLERYDPSLSEIENCHNNGLWRIYDCGKVKYCIQNKDKKCL